VKTCKKYGRFLLLAIPLVLGTVGLTVFAGRPLLDSIFRCITMYVLNYSDTPPNVLVDIARWLAPLATASWVVSVVLALRKALRCQLCYWFRDSVAVYGPREEQEALLAQLGKNGIPGADTYVKAHRYILLGDEGDNFAFYHQYQEKWKDAKVYLKCQALPTQSVTPANVKLFSMEETMARLFWKETDVLSAATAKENRLKILFIGFGRLGEELLYWGLQNNIFAPDQRLKYHIFGDCQPFLKKHPYIDQIHDPVIPHEEAWYESLPLVEQADYVLVVEQAQQTALVRELLFTTAVQTFHVFTKDASILKLLEEQDRLKLHRREEALQAERIFSDELFFRAKQINLHYARLYGQAPDTAEAMETEWQKLNVFTRYSNVSSADYHEIRLRMLRQMGLPADGTGMTAAQMDRLAQLEHIRWCRYHYLNNWHYGIPADGKNKDTTLRIHVDLRAYEALSEDEKEKDRQTVQTLLRISG
jgi:hypothetical protein